MITCGWCGKTTANRDRCTSCDHDDPARPWLQRGGEAPRVQAKPAGRPRLDPGEVRRRLAAAEYELDGRAVTNEALAEALGVDAATVRRWQKVAG